MVGSIAIVAVLSSSVVVGIIEHPEPIKTVVCLAVVSTQVGMILSTCSHCGTNGKVGGVGGGKVKKVCCWQKINIEHKNTPTLHVVVVPQCLCNMDQQQQKSAHGCTDACASIAMPKWQKRD